MRDPEYLEHIKEQPCIITGQRATDWLAIDPAHIGTAGRGLKSPDSEVFPLRHDLHTLSHSKGEMTFYREHLPDDVLRAALRALAREKYAEWKEGR